MNMKTTRTHWLKIYLALTVGSVGFALIAVYSHWAVAIGAFLCAFAHNIEKH